MKKVSTAIIVFLCCCCRAQVSVTNAKQAGNILYDILDKNTGQLFSFTKVDKYPDGTTMDLSKCDDVIYIQYKNEFFKRSYDGGINIRWFGCNESAANNQVIINKILATYKNAYIPEGVFKFSETIVVPENASLTGYGKTAVLKLLSKKPTDGISLFRAGVLKGFKLDCTETDMDVSAAVLVNAWNTVESLLGETRIQEVIITGNYPQLQGVAIKLAIQNKIIQDYSVISFCKFYDIDIYGFRDGIFCSLEYVKGKNISYINANIFDNIIIHQCLRPVRLINTADENDVVSGKSSIASNSFANIFIQHAVGNYAAFALDGASYNKIEGQIIDWTGSNTESTTKSKFNAINFSTSSESTGIKNR